MGTAIFHFSPEEEQTLHHYSAGLGIRSFAHRSFAHSLICSFRSNQMSDCEQFAQIAQDK